MVTAKLQGGLGNQMFQIGAAASYAKKYDLPYGFYFKHCYTPLQGKTSNYYTHNIFANIPELHNEELFNNAVYYKEPSHEYNEIPKCNKILLDGYFQSEKYLDRNFLISLFNLPKFSDESYSTIHVRRGDYLKFPNIHPVCPIEYYNKAIKIIQETAVDSDLFLVFSDDINWCRENIKHKNIEFVNLDEIQTLSYMKYAKNNIISNSSFSWWGAWLNNNPDKIVISPKAENWFGPDGPKKHDIIPNNFIQL